MAAKSGWSTKAAAISSVRWPRARRRVASGRTGGGSAGPAARARPMPARRISSAMATAATYLGLVAGLEQPVADHDPDPRQTGRHSSRRGRSHFVALRERLATSTDQLGWGGANRFGPLRLCAERCRAWRIAADRGFRRTIESAVAAGHRSWHAHLRSFAGAAPPRRGEPSKSPATVGGSAFGPGWPISAPWLALRPTVRRRVV